MTGEQEAGGNEATREWGKRQELGNRVEPQSASQVIV